MARAAAPLPGEAVLPEGTTAMHAGTAVNIIPDRAELLVNVRTFDSGVRDRVLDAITRIVRAEAVGWLRVGDLLRLLCVVLRRADVLAVDVHAVVLVDDVAAVLAAGLEPYDPGTPRDRVLTVEEIDRALVRALQGGLPRVPTRE